MKIVIATFSGPGTGSYTIDAVGKTEAQARRLCVAATKQVLLQRGSVNVRTDISPYIDTVDLEVGKAFYDMGKAGEVKTS